MEISYDKRSDALYIKFQGGQFARNKKIDDLTEDATSFDMLREHLGLDCAER